MDMHDAPRVRTCGGVVDGINIGTRLDLGTYLTTARCQPTVAAPLCVAPPPPPNQTTSDTITTPRRACTKHKAPHSLPNVFCPHLTAPRTAAPSALPSRFPFGHPPFLIRPHSEGLDPQKTPPAELLGLICTRPPLCDGSYCIVSIASVLAWCCG